MPRKEKDRHLAKDQLYQRIYNAVDVPSSIPLEVTHHQYKKVRADEIMRLINNGYSEDKAFSMVLGNNMRKKKKKSYRLPMLVSGAVAAASIVAIGAVVTTMSPATVSQSVSSQETMDDIAASAYDQTIVVAGMDTRPEEDKGDGTSQDVPGNRTDALAVVKISPASNKVVSVASIPRDTAVTTDSCDGGSTESVKVNSIYDSHGIKCLESVAGQITGEKIDGAIAFNFESFSTIVDSLGGIDITVDSPVVDDTLGEILPEAGTHTVDGRTALNYARARKVRGTAKSDLDRVNRQQEVAIAVMDKIKNASTATQVATVKDVITKVLPDTTIDGMSPADLLPIIKLVSTLTPNDIALDTIDITGEDGMGNLIYDEESSKEIFDMMKYSHSQSSVEMESTQGTQSTHG